MNGFLLSLRLIYESELFDQKVMSFCPFVPNIII